ncbi:MAG: hypothetical protein KJ569_01660, partial [Candidatus Omnitrophica bacterium]|nr:hypothetical protein [Candidatus Omnitrophota bacterium]
LFSFLIALLFYLYPFDLYLPCLYLLFYFDALLISNLLSSYYFFPHNESVEKPYFYRTYKMLKI